jgi:hypothetical protein
LLASTRHLFAQSVTLAGRLVVESIPVGLCMTAHILGMRGNYYCAVRSTEHHACFLREQRRTCTYRTLLQFVDSSTLTPAGIYMATIITRRRRRRANDKSRTSQPSRIQPGQLLGPPSVFLSLFLVLPHPTRNKPKLKSNKESKATLVMCATTSA